MEKEKKSQQGIGFWGTDGLYGCFSNFYPCKFVWQNQTFNCSEQAFMWAKAMEFEDIETADSIKTETEPYKIKKLGRQVKNYDDKVWSEKRFEVMLDIVYDKFYQNPDLKKILQGTGEANIFEDSPFDYIWGIGKKGTGQNLLGKVLMRVRRALGFYDLLHELFGEEE